jgi:hypothetical protein
MVVRALLIAAIAFAVARVARTHAQHSTDDEVEAPYTPSAGAAPFVSLGYREALADVLYVRFRAYLGEYNGTRADSLAALGEAITTLDPRFVRVYDQAANAITVAERGATQDDLWRAIHLLERGMQEFPREWALPYLAGQIYLQDLKTDDATQRRDWDERGTLLVESALRKPGAPLTAAKWAAFLRTKLGQQQRAIDGLKELLVITNDESARKQLIESLEKLTKGNDELVQEALEMRKQFVDAWRRERPTVPATMYLLIGARPTMTFDMADLATGGHDIVGADYKEPLEPLE